MHYRKTHSDSCVRGWRRAIRASALIIGAFIGCVASTPALGAPLVWWSVSATNLDSNGQCPPFPSSFFNSTFQTLYPTGNPTFQAGWVRVRGTVAPGSGTSFPSELRIELQDVPFGGPIVKLDPVSTSNAPITAAVVIDRYVNASSLGQVVPGFSEIRVRLCEQYDDIGVDAVWLNITIDFYRHPPIIAGPSIGVFTECPVGPPFKILDANGSGFVAMIGLYSFYGELLGMSDGASSPTGQASISLDGLPPGEYYLCCQSTGGSMSDGFDVAPATPALPGGVVVLNMPGGGSASARVHDDGVVWYYFRISPPACPDPNGDGTVNFDDIVSVLANWGLICP